MTHCREDSPQLPRPPAECERIAKTAIDPSNRAVTLELTARWRAMANESNAQEKMPKRRLNRSPRITGARARDRIR
jgi:hypothetical protein